MRHLAPTRIRSSRHVARLPDDISEQRRALRAVFLAGLAVAVLLAIGGVFAPDAWHDGLTKPSWQPPGSLFAPAWSVVYVMVCISFGLLLATPYSADQRVATCIFFVQLLLTAAWAPLFFGVHAPLLAFLDIVVLWLVTLSSIVAAARVNGWAALLLVPPLAWISFSLVLNGVIMVINGW